MRFINPVAASRHFLFPAIALIFAVFTSAWHGAWQEDARQRGDTGDFIELFDGESLDGWSGDPRFWSVVQGAIVGQTSAADPLEHNTFLILDGGEVADFELELEFRIASGNSGVQFRSVAADDFRVSGYQADLDAAHQHTGSIYEEGGRGVLVPRARHVIIDAAGQRTVSDEATGDEQALLASLAQNEWNRYRIVAQGSQITCSVNDRVSARLEDGEQGQARSSGIIALQLHTGAPMKAEFRNIRLKRN